MLLDLARDRDKFLDKELRPEGLKGVDAPLLASLRDSIVRAKTSKCNQETLQGAKVALCTDVRS